MSSWNTTEAREASEAGAHCSFTLDEAPLPHPAHLDGLTLFEDHGHRAVAAGELEHPLEGLAVLLDVVLHEFDPAPFEVFAGGRAVGATGCGVKFCLHAL